MKSIVVMLKNIRNLLPYFLLIVIYFFFINLEASKEKKIYQKNEKEKIVPNNKTNIYEKDVRIKIPVIPYNQ